MATRYSGPVKVTLAWSDRDDQYKASVSAPGEKTERMSIGRAPASRLAVDSPAAYDEAAHAAISFSSFGEHHAWSNAEGTGWHISRTKATAHGGGKAARSGDVVLRGPSHFGKV